MQSVQYTVKDTFESVNKVQSLEINRGDILLSYDVTSLFTNVPLAKTFQILANKAFHDNWFNKNHELNLSRDQLIELLNTVTKNQLFQFNGNLYEQTNGVTMGSPLGPLLTNVCAPLKINLIKMANCLTTCTCTIDDMWMTPLPSCQIYHQPEFFLTPQTTATHQQSLLIIEVEWNALLPFIRVELLNLAPRIKSKVYDNRYKHSLITTMLDRAYCIFSSISRFVYKLTPNF